MMYESSTGSTLLRLMAEAFFVTYSLFVWASKLLEPTSLSGAMLFLSSLTFVSDLIVAFWDWSS